MQRRDARYGQITLDGATPDLVAVLVRTELDADKPHRNLTTFGHADRR